MSRIRCLIAGMKWWGWTTKVFSHGDMKCDFTYIDDVVQGVLAALFPGGLGPYEIISLGNNQPERLMDMIRYLEDALCIEPQMEMLPMQPADVHMTFADISTAQAKLGYQPTTDLKTGIGQFVKWFQSWEAKTQD